MPKVTTIRALLLTDPPEARRRIRRAIEDNKGSIERSAAQLGIHFTTLHRILKDQKALRNYAARKRVDAQGG
jgi:transcriptional regulator of acetoin/glycerol metabolism